jgi:hypothetical protein
MSVPLELVEKQMWGDMDMSIHEHCHYGMFEMVGRS